MQSKYYMRRGGSQRKKVCFDNGPKAIFKSSDMGKTQDCYKFPLLEEFQYSKGIDSLVGVITRVAPNQQETIVLFIYISRSYTLCVQDWKLLGTNVSLEAASLDIFWKVDLLFLE